MKLSLNWIREYVDLPEDLTTTRLVHDLTMSTVEVEGAENLADGLKGVVLGRIVQVSPHPQADRLRVVLCDVGAGEPSTIVCGGVNLEAGQLVAVAVPGAMVRWHGEGDPVEIKATKLRGVLSAGMICSSGEIGLEELFPATREAEIMDLKGFPGSPGDPIAKVLDLDDVILEIDNKSLTNRPDLWGHYGIARELAAIYRAPLKPFPPADLPGEGSGIPVRIDDSDRCPRYTALVVENVRNVPSPYRLQNRIWKVGMRPINLLVDITNYVMLATGQPTHGFDRTHVHGGIRVRLAAPGETLELLNGEVLNLTGEDLVIADERSPLGLAGIMGGRRDSILPETAEIVLEAANFDALAIRRTAQRFDLRTEASSRYEKSMDPQRVDQALALSSSLFRELLPEARISGYTDVYPRPLERARVEVSLDFLGRRLGKEISGDEAKTILSLLGFEAELQGDVLRVTAPSWRSTGDISLPDDILEEIARLLGYENFDFLPPRITLTAPVNQRTISMERSIREYLAFRCGLQEVFTYPWIGDEYIAASGADKGGMIGLHNPPSPEESRIRSTLVPGLLKSIFTNLRYFDSFRIFELTQVFRDGDYFSPDDEAERLPAQDRHLGAAFVGDSPETLFREARGVLEAMPRIVQTAPLSFGQVRQPAWAEKKLWLNILLGDEVIGELALLSPRSARAAGIKRGQAVLFELDVEKLLPLPSRENRFVHLPMYPLVEQDLSLTFPEEVRWSDVEAIVAPMVREIRFVDEYRGKQVEEGKKSLTFRVWLGSDEGTLTSEQVEQTMERIAQKLRKKLGGELRG